MELPDLDLKKIFTQQGEKAGTEIQLIKEKIINFLYLTLMVFLLPALFSLLIRATSLGLKPVNYLHLGMTVILIVVFILRYYLSFKIKLGFLLFLIFSLSIGGLLTFGIYSYSFFFMLLGIILTYVLTDFKWGTINFIFVIIFYVVCAYLFITQKIDFDHQVIAFNNTAMGWFMGLIIFILVALMIVLLLSRLFEFLSDQIGLGKLHEDQLEQINRLLTREIDTRKKTENLLKKQVKDSNLMNQEYQRLNTELQDTNRKLEQSNELLKEAKEKAQTADMLKTSFLSNMSHEIRTPLNAIVGFSTLLSTGDYSPEEQKKYFGVIHSSSNYLLNIISDIVNMAKIEARQFTIYPEVIELNSFLDEISERYTREVFIQKEGDVNFELNKSIPYPCYIISDIECLRQVSGKLLDNAIKFTEKGYIRFSCSINEQNMLHIEVADTGIGIAPNIHNEVFDLFRQVEANSTRRFGGTGLGLSITKGLIDLLNGQIDFAPNNENGTIFTIRIPVIKKSDISTTQTPKIKVKTIMVVGKQTWDNVDINHVLQKTNSLLLFTETGFQAVEQFKNSDLPEIIIISSNLPDIKATRLANQIRELAPNIPIIGYLGLNINNDEMLEDTYWDYLIEPENNLHAFSLKIEQLLNI